MTNADTLRSIDRRIQKCIIRFLTQAHHRRICPRLNYSIAEQTLADIRGMKTRFPPGDSRRATLCRASDAPNELRDIGSVTYRQKEQLKLQNGGIKKGRLSRGTTAECKRRLIIFKVRGIVGLFLQIFVFWAEVGNYACERCCNWSGPNNKCPKLLGSLVARYEFLKIGKRFRKVRIPNGLSVSICNASAPESAYYECSNAGRLKFS
jgi:hypothetical protein